MTRSQIILFMCGLLVCGSCADTAPRTSAAERPVEGHVEATDGARLFYRMIGSGPDTVIVIHGGPGFTMDYFYEDLRPLASGHTLFFYDQRGTGRSTLVSDSAALGADQFVADLESIRRHLNTDKLTLFGHSWGATVAALYAQQFPERIERMVIVGPTPLQRSVLTAAFEDMAAARDSSTQRRMAEWRAVRQADPGDITACQAYYTLWFEPFLSDPRVLTQSKGDFCAGTAESRRNKMDSVDRYTAASLGDWDFRPAMKSIQAPTLVIHGTLDPLPLEGAREWSRSMRNTRILELEGVGHFAYLESPEVFFSTVNQFLRGEWPESARRMSN
jgi:proline iminopeptidase